MDRRTAGMIFLGTCLTLAVLLLTRTITPITSGWAFAVALALLGGASRGFRRRHG